MTYTREGLLLPESELAPLDSELERSLGAVIGGRQEIYGELTLSSERQAEVAEAWRNGQDASLALEIEDESSLVLRQGALRQWKQELLADDSVDPLVKQLYRWKVNEHIANINMLIASNSGDMKSFNRWNEFIYGKPDKDIYAAALDWFAHDAEVILSPESDVPDIVKEKAQKVLDMLEGKRGYRELLVPDSEVFNGVREDHMSEKGYYGLLLAGVEMPAGKITTEHADPIIKQVLKNIHSTKGVRDASGASWSVVEDAVLRPATMNMIPERFVGLGIGHEIGSHELERVNGSRGPLALARDGLDRVELGNEGRAVIREQVVYETFDAFGKLIRWRDILRRHAAIAFASGADSEGPASSSEVYAFINAIDQMYAIKAKPSQEVEAFDAASKKTSDLLLRVLKGTDGKGGAYLKDKVYLEGHVASWLSAAQKGPQAISEGDLGKFDINNPRHISALQEFGLLPEAN